MNRLLLKLETKVGLPRGSVMRFSGLLGSGLLASLVLMAIASQRIEWISGETVVFVLTFLQWQTFGLTVAKVGIDQVIFAIESGDPSVRFDIRRFVFTRSLPLAFVVSTAIGVLLTPWAGLIALISILFDVYSLAAGAELNARRNFSPVILSNFLNYPLFFVLGLAGSWFGDDQSAFIGAFVVSSLARMLWLLMKNRYDSGLEKVQFTSARPMFVQQILNYLLFRIDQLFLPLVSAVILMTQVTQERYVFQFKFPELVASGVNVLAVLAFPALLRAADWSSGRFRLPLSKKQVVLAMIVTLGAMGLFAVYQMIWGGVRDTHYWIVAMLYLLNGLLILPVNAVTYCFLAGERVVGLLRNQALSFGIGLVVVVLMLTTSSVYALALLVPVQLLSFLVLSKLLPIGGERPLYTRQATVPLGSST